MKLRVYIRVRLNQGYAKGGYHYVSGTLAKAA